MTIKRSGSARWIPGAERASALFDESLEPVAVDLVSLDPKHVSGAPRHEDLLFVALPSAGSERLAELRDVHLRGLD